MLNNNWPRELKFDCTSVMQRIKLINERRMSEEHYMLEEALDWKFGGLGFSTKSTEDTVCDFGEFLKQL